MKRFISLLLCLSLLISLAGCGGSTSSTTETTQVTETTAPPPPDPCEVYQAAVDKLNASPNLRIDITSEKEMHLGTDTFREKESMTVTMENVGTDQLLASSAGQIYWDKDFFADLAEVYSDGALYGYVGNWYYTSSVSQEEFLDRCWPAVLLEAGNYATVEFENDNTILFSDPIAPESWLGNEYTVLLDATGKVKLDAAGGINNVSCTFTYLQGAMEVTQTVHSQLFTSVYNVEVPEDLSVFVPTDSPDAALALVRAGGMLTQAQSLQTNSSETFMITAGMISKTEKMTVNAFGTGEDYMSQIDSSILMMDLDDQSVVQSYTIQESFRDGLYTITVPDSSPEEDPTVTADAYDSYIDDLATELYPLFSDLESLSMKDFGGSALLEFQYTDTYADSLTTFVCGSVYEDANLLDDNASDYYTSMRDGYLGIDTVTGLPTVVTMNYLGYHTLDGKEVPLAYEASCTYQFATDAPYELMTGEQLPIEEPENKATPLLYHVTGGNGEEMWLFGTIHVGDERTAYLPAALTDALSSCDALALEFDSESFLERAMNDPELAELIAKAFYYTDGTSILDHLEDDSLYDLAVEKMKSAGTYNVLSAVCRPVILFMEMPNIYLNLGRKLTSEYGAEEQLTKLAHEHGLEILDVESGESQIQMLVDYSEPLQELLLKSALETTPLEYQRSTSELYELWCQGDEAALIEAINSEETGLTEEELPLYEEYEKAMSTDRNADMLEVAKEYLSGDQLVFYAVGLAHLLAEDGLVNTLRQAGYTVELIPCK